MSKALEVTGEGPAHTEMEPRLAAIQTSLNAIENSISKFENLIEESQMLEEEARENQSSLGDEVADVKMVDQEDHGDPESSTPHVEADTKDNPPSASGVNTVSPEEEEILMSGIPNSRITAPGARQLWSQRGWQSYSSHPQPTLGLRRRLHHKSLRTPSQLRGTHSEFSVASEERHRRSEWSCEEEHEKTGGRLWNEASPIVIVVLL